MSIPLDGSEGLFTRLGHLIAALDEVNLYRGTTLVARTATVQGDYVSSDENLIDRLYASLSSAQSAAAGWPSYLRTLAQKTVTQMVGDFIALPNQNYATALAYLVQYLVDNTETVQANTVSATVTPGTNTGDGVVLCGMLSPLGVALEYAFAESILGTVTRDSQSGGAVAGQESLTFAGAFAVSDALSYLFPAGSGARTTQTAVNAGANNGRGTANMLANGSFETWVTLPNVPDNWHVGAAGVPGTSINQSTGQHYDGASSLNFLGDGSELTSVQSRFGTDFTATASPLTQYAVNLWLKADVVPGAGVLTVELVDGSGTQLLDAAGNASGFTISLPGITTGWVAHSGWLRTPRILPAQTWLRLRLSTALSTGKNLYIDRISLCQPAQFYQGGPYISAHSGATNWIAGDTFGIGISNDYGGLLQTGCNRVLGLRTSGLILPSVASSPSLSDALVV